MKIGPGTVVEMPVDDRFGYMLCTHRHPDYLDLMRVFRGLHDVRPSDLQTLVEGEVQFTCFAPLRRVIEDGYGTAVGIVDIPERLKPFPIFRAGMVDATSKKVAVWWLWDGEKEWRVGDLEPSQLALPIRGVYGAEVIQQYLREGWTPETSGR